ncbi:MAG: hypothetical protein JRG74_14370 [Deltaproteobacteria bacterium]|nr:hypothetical protein [Deltaproteobacteria bacterium]MBW2167218.1 hypothetical protein [Deltaproteobacteria bacterium]MCK5644066.1 hypothetical protein [Gammaproteobacteria bacterium]
MFKDLIISFCLRRIIPKSKRNRIPLSGPTSLSNDDYEIRIEQLKGKPDISYLVKDLRNDSIVLGEWDGDKEIISEVKLSDIKLNNFVIEHFYKNWRIKYSGIVEAALHEIFKLNFFKRIFQKVYDKNLDNFNDRFELLKILVAYWKPNHKDYVPTEDILVQLYGSKIRTSDKKYECLEHLSFILRSLKESGDIEIKENYIVYSVKVNPKAMTTLTQFEIDSTRHRDTIRITRYQLWVAVAMVFLAASTLIVNTF